MGERELIHAYNSHNNSGLNFFRLLLLTNLTIGNAVSKT